VTNEIKYGFETFPFKQPYHKHQWTKSKSRKTKVVVYNIITHYYKILKKKLFVIWKKTNFKEPWLKLDLLHHNLELLHIFHFFSKIHKKFYTLVYWYTSFQIVVYKSWRKLTFIRFKIFTLWQIYKWCWFSQYLNIFWNWEQGTTLAILEKEYKLQHKPLLHFNTLAFEYLLNKTMNSTNILEQYDAFLVLFFF